MNFFTRERIILNNSNCTIYFRFTRVNFGIEYDNTEWWFSFLGFEIVI